MKAATSAIMAIAAAAILGGCASVKINGQDIRNGAMFAVIGTGLLILASDTDGDDKGQGHACPACPPRQPETLQGD